MLHAIEQLRRAADGVRYHHERWDGTGYRAGLAAHDIPVIARIIAVADAFDAVLSNRSYRKGQSAEEAVARIAEGAGTQFDPDVVDALQRLLPLLQKHQWVLLSGQKSPASA
jgi:HD-GYP domain-containing protein (c-di-GMP phosphodiesterase class II)